MFGPRISWLHVKIVLFSLAKTMTSAVSETNFETLPPLTRLILFHDFKPRCTGVTA